MTARDEVVLPLMLERRAAEAPAALGAIFEDGSTWTWLDACAEMHAAAHALASMGVRPGDRVGLMLDNSADWLRCWWGVSAVGGVLAPLNTAFKGPILADVTRRIGAKLIIAGAQGAAAIEASGAMATVVDPSEVRSRRCDRWVLDRPLEPWDVNTINLTSGTTGASKLVVSRWQQTYMGGHPSFGAGAGLTPDDRWLMDLPLFHVASQQMTHAAIGAGASIALRARFTASNYWTLARDVGATRSLLVASMVHFLLAQPAGPHDRDHGIRSMMICPVVSGRMQEFASRFGIREIRTSIGSTETGAPIGAVLDDEPEPHLLGRPRPGITVRLADEHDDEVPDGEVGQILLRCDQPWEISAEYLDDPVATSAAWRNGWFHMGDAARRGPDGNLYFVDRLRDTIRRRGENVSSADVEAALLAFDGVVEAACVGVESTSGEQEVAAWLVADESRTIDLPALVAHLADRLPYFMVPRFFEVVASLPKTPTHRVEKYRLRQSGLSAGAFDREAAGLLVTRSGLRTGIPGGPPTNAGDA